MLTLKSLEGILKTNLFTLEFKKSDKENYSLVRSYDVNKEFACVLRGADCYLNDIPYNLTICKDNILMLKHNRTNYIYIPEKDSDYTLVKTDKLFNALQVLEKLSDKLIEYYTIIEPKFNPEELGNQVIAQDGYVKLLTDKVYLQVNKNGNISITIIPYYTEHKCFVKFGTRYYDITDIIGTDKASMIKHGFTTSSSGLAYAPKMVYSDIDDTDDIKVVIEEYLKHSYVSEPAIEML